MTDEGKKKEEKINWAEYSRLVPPEVELGIDKYLYDNTKRIERLTKTNEYITNKNKTLKTLLPNINQTYKAIMDREELKDVPYFERNRIAMKMAKQQAILAQQIVEEVYPEADKAVVQASKISEAKDIIDGNVGVKKERKPRKPRKSTKAPKKSTKSGMKPGRPAGSKNKKK